MSRLLNGPIPKPHILLTPKPGVEEGVTNRQLQIEHIMWVIERPDHHCGDDLVFLPS